MICPCSASELVIHKSRQAHFFSFLRERGHGRCHFYRLIDDADMMGH